MKLLFTPFAFVLSISLLQAQNDSVSYQNDIGFNTTFILQGILQSNETPFSIMYKKYRNDHTAWRFGADLYVNINKTDSKTSSSNFTDYSSGYVGFVAGAEFQKPIDKRWVWYYGGDFVPFYSFNNQNSFQNGELTIESEGSSFGLGFRPFLGIRFNISRRLYASAEANMFMRYIRSKNYSSLVGSQEPYTDTEASNFTFSVSPATGLFLFYRF